MPLVRYTVRQLEAFSAVAELLSFAAAADRLCITRSAVSQLVTELEAVIGFKLFERTTRKVALTAGGREFLLSVDSALKHLHLAEAAAADVRNRASGLVRVAAPMVIAGSLLPNVVKRYASTRPKVVVRIRDVPVDRLVDAVSQGDVDLAIGPDRGVGADVERRALFDSPWVLWCQPDHPLARQKVIRWSDLRDQPLVAAGRDHERSVAQMRSGLPDSVRITPVDVVDNISTALGVAAEGLALTLSPAYVRVWAERLGLVMRRVIEPEVMRQVCLYRPTQRPASSASDGFADFVESALRGTGAPAQRGRPSRERLKRRS